MTTAAGLESTAPADLVRPSFPPHLYLKLAPWILGIDFVQALSVLQENPRLEPWEPWVWEFSSGLSSILLLPLIAFALRWAPPERGGWLRFALVHSPGSFAYSLLHVAGFWLVRTVIYGAQGLSYRLGPTHDRGALGNLIANLGYEYRKDIVSYAGLLAVFWIMMRIRTLQAQTQARNRPRTVADREICVFDIREGTKLIRAPVAEIIAARSAGNYVEVLLADGRRPLMRATLASVEAALTPVGFVRTHRSWLINPSAVRTMVAEGSGDFRLDLNGGAEAPLSRRFPQALEALRRSA